MFAIQITPEMFQVDKSFAHVLSLFTRISPYDLVFMLTAIAFNLLIAGIFIAQKKERLELIKTFGMTWLLLTIPLAIVFISYLAKHWNFSTFTRVQRLKSILIARTVR